MLKNNVLLILLFSTTTAIPLMFTEENIATTKNSELQYLLNEKIFKLLQIKIPNVNIHSTSEYREVFKHISICIEIQHSPDIVEQLKELKRSSNNFKALLDSYEKNCFF